MQKIGVQEGNTQWKCHVVLGIVCALVIGVFVWYAEPGFLELSSPRPGGGYYNLLVQGFRAGQLNVNREPPPELAQLADPYNPAANAAYVWGTSDSYPCFDMSYYKGKLYLYFGVTPALVLFWPYVALTGHYLTQKNAVVIFFALGFLISAGLLRAVWQRYFPEVSVWVVAPGVLMMGFATGILEILACCDVYEVAISGGFMFAMLALAAIWRALHEPKRQMLWLLLASLAYGLAIGSRPSLLFGAIILLVPVLRAWRAATEPGSRRRAGLLFIAAVGPLMLIGAGLMLYNFLRFDNPFEFGLHYQLTGYWTNTVQKFSLRYLWLNFRFYFLQPMLWTGHFPFLQAVSWLHAPLGYLAVGEPYSGILGNYPVVWLALAAPLAWRGRLAGEVSGLRWFVTAPLLLFVTCALPLCLFFSASVRYEMDFLPALMLLAVLGIFGLERVLVRSRWRFLARAGWGLLLAYSLGFNFLASVEAHAAADHSLGYHFFKQGRENEGIGYLQKAVALQPESADYHNYLGYFLFRAGRIDEAIAQFQRTLKIQPDYYPADYNLGRAFYTKGMTAKAKDCFEKVIKLDPQSIPGRVNLAWMLATWPEPSVRNGDEALALVRQAEQLSSGDDPIMLRTLAAAYAEKGQFSKAVATAQEALRLATRQSASGLTNSLQKEIELYQTHSPCRTREELTFAM